MLERLEGRQREIIVRFAALRTRKRSFRLPKGFLASAGVRRLPRKNACVERDTGCGRMVS